MPYDVLRQSVKQLRHLGLSQPNRPVHAAQSDFRFAVVGCVDDHFPCVTCRLLYSCSKC